jgi:hypothetical protein
MLTSRVTHRVSSSASRESYVFYAMVCHLYSSDDDRIEMASSTTSQINQRYCIDNPIYQSIYLSSSSQVQ